MKSSQKPNRVKREHIIIAAVCTFLTCAIIVTAIMVKLYAFENYVKFNFWVSLGTISFIVVMMMVCLLLFLVTSNKYIVKQSNYYLAYMAIISFVVVTGVFLSLISPLFIPIAYASLLVYPITRKNSSAFIINMICALIILMSGLYEYLISDGQVYTVIGESSNVYLWEMFTVCLFGIVIGGILPYTIRYKTKRTRYIIACTIFNGVSLGLIALLVFGNYHLESIYGHFWMVSIAMFIPLITSLILNPVIESVFNLITDNRLVELTDSKQPLIARLIAEAPGTFNHCLAVANFAEICANAIGEDPYLARAAAYYHDVGKLENPEYFSENQRSKNPLDELLPEVSAQIIRNHCEDGFKLCEKHRVPEEISGVTVEHHGTLPIKVFYERAKQLTDSEIDIRDFSYHGRTPTTKIAAIIMICDAGEAAIRAMDKPDGERVDALLRGLINERIQYGQFDNCDISMNDLNVIRNAIIAAFGGLFHKRVKYPGGESEKTTK